MLETRRCTVCLSDCQINSVFHDRYEQCKFEGKLDWSTENWGHMHLTCPHCRNEWWETTPAQIEREREKQRLIEAHRLPVSSHFGHVDVLPHVDGHEPITERD